MFLHPFSLVQFFRFSAVDLSIEPLIPKQINLDRVTASTTLIEQSTDRKDDGSD